jgi:uncharacterized protein
MSARLPTEVPWYRHLWPWLLMLPPVTAVFGGVGMLYLALNTSDTLSVDDYSHIEDLTQQEFARDQVARALGITAELVLSEDSAQGARAEITLAAAAPYERPDTLLLHLRHPTRAEFDRELKLARQGDVYHATTGTLPATHYEAELLPGDGSWRLATQIRALPARVALAPVPGD